MQVEAYVEVYDEKGKLILRKKAESWIRNFLYYVYGVLTDSSLNMVDYGGTTYTIRTSGDVNIEAVRIRLGIDLTPPSFGDYRLVSEITNFVATVAVSPITGGYRITIYGTYTPTTSTTVYEIGLSQAVFDTGGSGRTVLLFRDLFPTGVYHDPNQPRTYTITVEVKV